MWLTIEDALLGYIDKSFTIIITFLSSNISLIGGPEPLLKGPKWYYWILPVFPISY